MYHGLCFWFRVSLSVLKREGDNQSGISKDFAWGAATASYQVEGAAYKDGKGLNIWDVFCMDSGKVYENHNGDVACNHYELYKEDVKMMKEMGLKAYRFSISWPRELCLRVREK